MVKLIIFDLDGTILDTIADLGDAVNHGLRLYGFPARSYDEIKSFVGNGVPKLIERALPDGEKSAENIEKVCAAFGDYYAAHCADKTRPYAGMPELVGELRGMGVKLAVFSNKPQRFTEGLIGRFYPGAFDVVRGSVDGVPRKPDPAGELLIIGEAGAAPETTLHIGDSVTDIATARNAGADVLACSWGYRPREELSQAGADTSDTVAELRGKILLRLRGGGERNDV